MRVRGQGWAWWQLCTGRGRNGASVTLGYPHWHGVKDCAGQVTSNVHKRLHKMSIVLMCTPTKCQPHTWGNTAIYEGKHLFKCIGVT